MEHYSNKPFLSTEEIVQVMRQAALNDSVAAFDDAFTEGVARCENIIRKLLRQNMKMNYPNTAVDALIGAINEFQTLTEDVK